MWGVVEDNSSPLWLTRSVKHSIYTIKDLCNIIGIAHSNLYHHPWTTLHHPRDGVDSNLALGPKHLDDIWVCLGWGLRLRWSWAPYPYGLPSMSDMVHVPCKNPATVGYHINTCTCIMRLGPHYHPGEGGYPAFDLKTQDNGQVQDMVRTW